MSSRTGVVNAALVVCLCFFGVQAVVHDIPDYFPRCKRFDPKLNECLLKATETMKPFLLKGIPEFNIPSIDPFTIPEVSLQQTTRTLNFKAILKNIQVKGLSNYKFSQFDFDVPNLQFLCKLKVAPLNLEGNFTGSGSYLSTGDIAGDGVFTASIENSDITIVQKVQVIKKRGKEFLKTVQTNTTIDVSNPKAHLDGLFEGDKTLNKGLNDLINDNVESLFKDLKPVIEKVITTIIEDLLFRTIESNVPYDRLYEPSA